jgi:ABC-type uncharacterized transport system substrate-binding protein
MKLDKRVIGSVAGAASMLAMSATAAISHPHVWVTYETTVNYDQGAVSGVTHIWSFDDMYTAMAVQGLDKNGDGAYDREELSELAKVNMDGLKEFGFFTFAKLSSADLKFNEPEESWLEYKDGILKLHFKLPLEKPVLAEAEGLNVSIYDPSFFISFEPEKTDAVKVSSAPDGCSAALVEPAADEAAEQAKRLGDAMAQNLGGDIAAGMGSYGAAKTIAVTCKKS